MDYISIMTLGTLKKSTKMSILLTKKSSLKITVLVL